MSSRTTAAAAIAALVVGAGPALPARAGDDVERRGGCSGSASWKLKVKPDDGRLELEAEVDSNRRGQTWRWRIWHNGDVSARGRATTRGSSGSFEVERRMSNLSGTDTFRFRARHDGQVCRGTIRW